MWNCWAYKMFENGRWMVFEQGMFNKITFNDLLWPKMAFWPEWSNKSKFLKESKIKKFFEKHKAEIFSHATPGHQLDMLSMRMEINIILLEDTTFWSKFLVKILSTLLNYIHLQEPNVCPSYIIQKWIKSVKLHVLKHGNYKTITYR